MNWIASAAFGLEGQVKSDLQRIAACTALETTTGGVRFTGGPDAGFLANLWLRTADRVSLVVGEFEARSFEELFQGVYGLNWAKLLPKDAAFPIRAHCARSQLMSPSDCQSITKKAIVESLRKAYKIQDLHENGATLQVDVAIHADRVLITLDASGEALNRRGYRTWNGEAPIRETLAAALLGPPWRANMPLHDPCCGTGTILIEAAFRALDRAPGLNRAFACEQWPFMDAALMQSLRAEAEARFEAGRQRPIRITGTDIDPEAIELARRHIRQAGLEGLVEVQVRDVRELRLPEGPGMILTNPPYGERMGDRHVAGLVAKQLGELQKRSPGWALGAITADRNFEKSYGKRADKRKRLYNGRLECEYMVFGVR